MAALIRDQSPLESWEVEVRMSDKSLASLMRCIIAVNGQIRDTYRSHAHLYEGLKDAWRDPAHILIQIPRDSVTRFRELWGNEMWNHPVVNIPRQSMGNRRREMAWKNQGVPAWNPGQSDDRDDAI